MGVFGVADPGDGMQLVVHTVGGHTAQKVQLVFTGGSDEQIGACNVCLLQNRAGGAVACHRHGIKTLHRAFHNGVVPVDDSQIVPLGRKLTGKGLTHLAAAGNDDLHMRTPKSCK